MAEKVLQCEFCGRVRINGEWMHHNHVQPQVVGFCATCDEWRKRTSERKRRREARRVEAWGNQGAHPLPPGTDPFRGFRGEEN